VNICRWRRYAWLISALGVVSALVGCTLFNAAPIADFEYRITWRFVPGQVVFDASPSRDPDGTIVRYEWDFGDGSTGSEESIRHTYATAGTFTARLAVSDNLGKVSTTSQDLSIFPPDVSPPPSPLPPQPPPAPPPDTPGVVRLEGSGYTQSSLPLPSGARWFFMEHVGDGRFSVVLLDAWSQRAAQLVSVTGDFEGRVYYNGGGGYQGPFSLDVDAVGPWAITIVEETPQALPLTYSGCEQAPSPPLLAHYSPLFTLKPGTATFYYSDSGGWGGSCVLLDYSRSVEIPLEHEVQVSGGAYLLKVRSSGCWQISVEQAQ